MNRITIKLCLKFEFSHSESEAIPNYDGFPTQISEPIAVAERSKTQTVFARSNTEIVGSNPTQAWMFVCVLCAFFLFLHSLK
jgi:hypothetical protein